MIASAGALPEKQRPESCDDDGRSQPSRVAEVRQRAQEERDKRDEARKRELENAMREARRDRLAMQERRLARESNPVIGTPSRQSGCNPNAPPDASLESDATLQTSVAAQEDINGLRQDLAKQAEARKELQERNEACFSPPHRPELGIIEIPFHDRFPLPQGLHGASVESTSKLGLGDVTRKPFCALDCNLNSLEHIAAETTRGGGGLLCGSSKLVPILHDTEVSPRLGLADTDIENLQAILASALTSPSGMEKTSLPAFHAMEMAPQSSAQAVRACEDSRIHACTPSSQCVPGSNICCVVDEPKNMDDSLASLEYSLNSTGISATSLSSPEVFDTFSQDARVPAVVVEPGLQQLAAIAEEPSGFNATKESKLLPHSSTHIYVSSSVEPEAMEVNEGSDLPCWSSMATSPSPEPPATNSDNPLLFHSHRPSTFGGPLSPLSSPSRVTPAGTLQEQHTSQLKVKMQQLASEVANCSSPTPHDASQEAQACVVMASTAPKEDHAPEDRSRAACEQRKKCLCKPSCVLM